ncbi:MAG: RluA family pseudouridine synthase [Clostridia bacterium]|nr:RluA family pseudouridine synthase [Clostridia bacterium]
MIPVLYIDDYFLICIKPVGLISESPGLPDILSAQLNRKLYPVHRLDQGTGGVCMLALSSKACAGLQKLFTEDRIQKEYLAVISGVPETSQGTYRDLLYHDKKTNKSYIVSHERKGVKEALCNWTVLGSAEHDGQPLSLLRILLHTGRTHQIRVQFASRGYPLAGDRRYGSRIRASVPALWASGISFSHPWNDGAQISVSSRPDSVFPWSVFDSDDL